MVQLTTNTTKGKFGGTKIDLNANILSVTVGNNLTVYAGMSNAAYFGAKTQLVSGVATNINLGSSISCTYGNILGASYGNCWAWSAANNTTFDVATRWGATQNIFAGGVSNTSYGNRLIEETQGKLILMAVLGSYIISVGSALLGMQYPPFTMEDDDKDGEASGVETNNNNALITCLVDGVSAMLLAFGQWWAAQLFSRYKNFDPVSYMDFTAAGINCEVYAFPDTVPADNEAEIPKPASTATMNAKAAFYMRPYQGRVMPAVAPLNRAPKAYPLSGSPLPETELLTYAGPAIPSFSQIYISPEKINIGAGLFCTPDTDVAGVKTSMATTRVMGTAPKILLDNKLCSVSLTQDQANMNSIIIDPVQTAITRVTSGKINVSTGAVGLENQFTLDATTGATLATPTGSIAINSAGETNIISNMFLVGGFSTVTGIKLMSGSGLQMSAGGIQYTGPLIQI